MKHRNPELVRVVPTTVSICKLEDSQQVENSHRRGVFKSHRDRELQELDTHPGFDTAFGLLNLRLGLLPEHLRYLNSFVTRIPRSASSCTKGSYGTSLTGESRPRLAIWPLPIIRAPMLAV